VNTGAAALNPANRATVINPRTKDKAEGKFHEVKDKVKGEIRTTDQ
jgi:hypothetical protein